MSFLFLEFFILFFDSFLFLFLSFFFLFNELFFSNSLQFFLHPCRAIRNLYKNLFIKIIFFSP
ncbi:MAG: hypothetical protein E7314_04565 [Clostridiales bacterium]|nr:hypothetical protein [Clostridiales bacterium]